MDGQNQIVLVINIGDATSYIFNSWASWFSKTKSQLQNEYTKHTSQDDYMKLNMETILADIKT